MRLAEAPLGREVTLATAGHVDHGKSALVEALTGTRTDRLEEERRRGISIELGFARLELADGRALGVVDVPGHHRLVRAMVSGCSGIDMFLLVIAADDGVMPQTREHLTVLRSLGIERGLIALSKCDAAPSETRALAREEALELAPGLAIVEVSARTGAGLEELRETIAGVASAATGERRAAWPRRASVLHLDRVFSLKGIGTVGTGTLRGGPLEAGGRVRVMPSELEVRVRGIQVHGESVEWAHPGQRVALNLAGIDREQLRRGDVVASGEAAPRASYRLDVELDFEPESPSGPRRVQVHHGTRMSIARLVVLGEGRLAQLRLDRPIIAQVGERFVIRSIAPPGTLGGGLVIDAAPPRHGPGLTAAALRRTLEGTPEEVLQSALESAPDGIGRTPSTWVEVSLLGFALGRFDERRWLEATMALLESGGAEVAEDGLRSPSRAPAEAPRPAAAKLDRTDVRVLRELDAAGLQPPGAGLLAQTLELEPGEIARSLERLVDAGHVARLSGGVLYPAGTVRRVIVVATELARERGSISIAELRDGLRISRRYSQAILEQLDAGGITVRHGDRHVLRRPGAA